MRNTLYYLCLLAACAGVVAPSPIRQGKQRPFKMERRQIDESQRQAINHLKRRHGASETKIPTTSTHHKKVRRAAQSTVTAAPVIVTRTATRTAVATAYTTDVTITTKVKTVTADSDTQDEESSSSSSKSTRSSSSTKSSSSTTQKPTSSSTPSQAPTPTDDQSATTTISTTQIPIPTGSEVVFAGGRGTWYYTGLGACGWYNYDNEYVVAVSSVLYDNFPGATPENTNANPVCGQLLDITYGSNTIRAAVVDRCVGCSVYDLDLAPSAFAALANLDQGELWGMTWKWV